MTTDPVELGPYAGATQLVLRGLASAAALAGQARGEEAASTVRGMHVPVQSLLGAATAARQNAATEASVAQQQLELLELNVGEIYKKEQDAQAQITALQGQLTDNETRQKLTRSASEALRAQVAGLQVQLRELQERRDELNAWFWVPGYGAYLGIRALAEDDAGRLRSRTEELGRIEAELQRDDAEVRSLSALLAAMQDDDRRLRERHDQLHRLRGDVETRKREVARRMVVLLQVELFYSTTMQRLTDLHRRLDDVEMMLGLLESARDEAASLEESLLAFARSLDEGSVLAVPA